MPSITDRIQLLINENNDIPSLVFEKIGIRKNALTEWNKGKGSPSVDAITKIAHYYNISTDYLILGTQSYNDLSPEEKEWLSLYNQLDSHDKIECTGFIKGYIAKGSSRRA